MGKHAYLIVAHNNFDMLGKLLQALDDERNDIYLHIDKKASFDSAILDCCTKASVTVVPRIRVEWGGYSQIQYELILLKEATKSQHDYYHLLSGVDIPLKTQDEIHAFFDANHGNEYIDFDTPANQTRNFADRYQRYWFFRNLIGRNHPPLQYLQDILISLQKKLHITRAKHAPFSFYKGANWFSITHKMALYVLSRRKDIKKYFRFSHCCDEVFLHTIAMDSPYKDRIVDDSLRLIDWERGEPYTFQEEDYPLLTQCDQLFARKFDDSTDPVIIDKLYQYLNSKQVK